MKKLLVILTAMMCSHAIAAKEEVYTNKAPQPIGVYSQAIKINNNIYISGQIPVDPLTGELIQGDFKAQIKQTFINIREIAQAAGAGINDIVKMTIYLTNLNNFSMVNEVMLEVFTKPYPARAVIEIKSLPKNAPVEIEAIIQKS